MNASQEKDLASLSHLVDEKKYSDVIQQAIFNNGAAILAAPAQGTTNDAANSNVNVCGWQTLTQCSISGFRFFSMLIQGRKSLK